MRELLTVRDKATGQVMTNGDSIRITGLPEDGAPDSISLLIDVDGIEDGDAGLYVLHLEIDGKPFNPMVVGSAGVQAGPYTNPKGSSCSYSGKVVVPPLVNLLNRLTIHTLTLRCSGYRQSAGPIVKVMEQGPGQQASPVPFDSSSIRFVANETGAFVADGAAVEGSYQSSATSRFDWSFVKLE